MKQQSFEKIHWRHRFSHGGSLRNQRAGRSARPLSSRDPIHLVFKARRETVKTGFRTYRRYFLIQRIVEFYSRRFYVKIEQISVQGDHLHLLVRTGRRSNFQSFFRVVAGQIAQQFQKQQLVTDPLVRASKPHGTDKPGPRPRLRVTDTPRPETRVSKRSGTGLWKYRPFTRVVKGWRAYRIVRDYIQLNEREVLGERVYRKERLRGLQKEELEALWV